MTNTNNLVVTLLAEKGKKWEETQECIASYDGSIVFLPRDVRAGDIVRVQLIPIGEKLDARGKVMYRTQPAPVFLPGNVKHQIAKEASWLRSCQVFDEPTALALLRAQYGVELGAWKGYSHYFFEKSGWVFGSHLPPATLYLYEQFGTIAPHAMTEPLMWLLDKQFFALREQGGELDWRSPIPQLTDEAVAELVGRVQAGEPVLSKALVQIIGGQVEIPALVDALWRGAKWPTLPVPDFFEGGDDVPAIVEHEYGKVPNGEILKGYAVFGPKAPAWYRHRTEAEEAHQQAVGELNQLRVVWANRTLIEPRVLELSIRREKVGLSILVAHKDFIGTHWDLNRGPRYEYAEEVFASLEEETSKKETEVVKTAMEAAMREAQKRAEAEAVAKAERDAAGLETDLQRRETAGGIIRPYRVWVHTSGQAGDGGAYVITKTGEIRLHDRDEYERSHGRGAHHQIWDLVVESDGVIEWSAGSNQQPRQPTLPVRKVPVGGWTEAQIETVNRLETELNVPFGKGWGLSLPEVIQDGKLASNKSLARLVSMFKKG